MTFVLLNRAVDQPYRILGTWVIDQWRQIGLKVTQNAVPTGPWTDSLRVKKDYQVAIDANCQSIVNPIVDVSKYLGSASNNYAQYEDEAALDIEPQPRVAEPGASPEPVRRSATGDKDQGDCRGQNHR